MKALITAALVLVLVGLVYAGRPQGAFAHLHAQTPTWVWDESRPITAIHFVPSSVKGYYLTTFDWADDGPDTQLHTDDVEFSVTFPRWHGR